MEYCVKYCCLIWMWEHTVCDNMTTPQWNNLNSCAIGQYIKLLAIFYSSGDVVHVDTVVKVKFDLLDLFFNFPPDFSSSQPESKITHLMVLDWWFKHQALWTSQTGIRGPGVFHLTVIGAEGSLKINVGNSWVVLYNSWKLVQLEKVSSRALLVSTVGILLFVDHLCASLWQPQKQTWGLLLNLRLTVCFGGGGVCVHGGFTALLFLQAAR